MVLMIAIFTLILLPLARALRTRGPVDIRISSIAIEGTGCKPGSAVYHLNGEFTSVMASGSLMMQVRNRSVPIRFSL
jgi:hypothetical protein